MTGNDIGGTVTNPFQAKATPMVIVTGARDTDNGSPYPATVTVTGVDGEPVITFDGVSPTFMCYHGTTANGNGSSSVPRAPGTYTVVTAFAGSANYVAAESQPARLTITQTTTIGLYDSANSWFHLRNSDTSGPDDYTFGYGDACGGWIPLVGDWDGGRSDGVGLLAS